jgi:hypothetical protein
MERIHFYPQNSNFSDIVGLDVLWMMTYRKNGIENEYLVDFLERRIGIAYPLSFWIERIDCYEPISYGVDYPYKKTVCTYDGDKETLNITLTALDINAENHNCIHTVDIASMILSGLKLPAQGSYHPEKFHTKLNIYFDTITNDTEKINKLRVIFSNLERLCEHCVKYESKIEWKLIGTETNNT